MNGTIEYNGWKNYETWVVNMWLNNEELSYYLLEELKIEPLGTTEKAERLEAVVRELYAYERYGIVADLVNTAFGRVDWVAIVQAD